MASPPIVRKIGRKIILVFHYFACIERNTSQVFSTGYIENIKEALEIYEQFNKKILLEWLFYASTDKWRALPKLKANLEKSDKYPRSTFYLLIKRFQEKNTPEENNIKILIENMKKELQFLLGSKKF